MEEVAAYRAHVDAAMIALLEEGGGDFATLVELGLHHEQQHQEFLLTDILHAFAQNSLHPAYHAHRPISARLAPVLGFTDFEGGVVEIGHDGEDFAFDNEGPRHRTVLEPYRLADRLITNGEWLEFMAAGGYRDRAVVARRWLAMRDRKRLERAALLAGARWRVVLHDALRPSAAQPPGARHPYQLL